MQTSQTFSIRPYLIVAGLFIVWAIAFIADSSVAGFDGKTYFCLFDDAMISARYAWNLAQGDGLVWNAGEFVEGYTNLLMTLVMSVPMLFLSKSASLLVIQILGIALVLYSAAMASLIAGELMKNEPHPKASLIRLLSFILALAYYPSVYWPLMGMETGLLTVLLLTSIWLSLRYNNQPHFSWLLWIGLLMGLAYLARPDSTLYAALIFGFILLQGWSVGRLKDVFLQLFAAGLIIVAFIAAQMAFRYHYYGELTPNTYTLKLTGWPLSARIENGYYFIERFVERTALVWLLVAIDLTFNFRRAKLYLFAFFLLTLVYQVFNGGDPWIYWRLFAPTMPLLFLLLIIATFNIAEAIKLRTPRIEPRESTHYRGKTGIALTMLLIAFLWADSRFLPKIFFTEPQYQADENQEKVNIALALNDVLTEDARIGVTWAGSIPFYSGRYGIDFLGKMDKYIAGLAPDISGAVAWKGMFSVPGHNKYDLEYSILQLKPDWVQKLWMGQDDLKHLEGDLYLKAEYQGIPLLLLKGSKQVNWHLVQLAD